MNKAEITMIKDIIETQESWFFTFEASMGELRSQLRRLESSLVETMGQRLSSLERTTDEHTQRLLSLETALREWSSRLLSLQSMAEAWSNDLLDVRNVVQHESTTRIQQIDQVNKAQEDVRKAGERMLYSIAILGRGLEDIYEHLFEKRLLLLEASSRLGEEHLSS